MNHKLTTQHQRDYRNGYEMGVSGEPLQDQDDVSEAFREGHAIGYGDHLEAAFGEGCDMEGVGLVMM